VIVVAIVVASNKETKDHKNFIDPKQADLSSLLVKVTTTTRRLHRCSTSRSQSKMMVQPPSSSLSSLLTCQLNTLSKT